MKREIIVTGIMVCVFLLTAAYQETGKGNYAEIYVHDNAVAQSIATGASYVKLTAFASNGLSSVATSDVANDKITITHPGIYHVTHTAGALVGTAASVMDFSIFLNGVEQQQCETSRKYGTSGDVGAHAINCLLDVTTVPWDIDVRARHDRPGAVDLTIQDASLVVEFTGET